jgi:hypothetical protein
MLKGLVHTYGFRNKKMIHFIIIFIIFIKLIKIKDDFDINYSVRLGLQSN